MVMNKEQIKALRQKLGLTQKELAQKIGVDQVSVNRWENGVSYPSPMAQKQLDDLENEGISVLSPAYNFKGFPSHFDEPKSKKVVGYSKERQIKGNKTK